MSSKSKHYQIRILHKNKGTDGVGQRKGEMEFLKTISQDNKRSRKTSPIHTDNGVC